MVGAIRSLAAGTIFSPFFVNALGLETPPLFTAMLTCSQVHICWSMKILSSPSGIVDMRGSKVGLVINPKTGLISMFYMINDDHLII